MLPAFTRVVMAFHHSTAVSDHVLVDPMAAQCLTVLLEVHIVAMSVNQAASDVKKVVRCTCEGLIRHEGQRVMVG